MFSVPWLKSGLLPLNAATKYVPPCSGLYTIEEGFILLKGIETSPHAREVIQQLPCVALRCRDPLYHIRVTQFPRTVLSTH